LTGLVSAIRTNETHAETALRKDQNQRKKRTLCVGVKDQKHGTLKAQIYQCCPKFAIAEKLTAQGGKT